MKNFKTMYTVIIMALIMVASGCKKDDEGVNKVITVTDIDGNNYQAITLGTQVWMNENLKVTRFQNGDSIRTTRTRDMDIDRENAPKYQWPYNGNKSNVDKYGRLYTWDAAMDSRGICPQGWHVPSDAEWTTLTDFVGGENNAQKVLREKGFRPQYGGWRLADDFTDLDMVGIWWSSSFTGNEVPWATDQVFIRSMSNNANNVYRDYRYKKSAVSIRCVRN